MPKRKQAVSTDPEFFPENVELLTFIGGWDCFVGVDTVHTLFYLIRTKDLDWLEEVVKYSSTIISRHCVMSIPREGSPREAAKRLLDAHVRSRVHYECPVAPYRSGMLLTSDELQSIVRAIADELKRNSEAAEEEQRRHQAPIVEMAKALGLGPRPAGHNDVDWMANCPRSSSHWITISPPHNEFGCGYCHRKGGPQELRAFCNSAWTETPLG